MLPVVVPTVGQHVCCRMLLAQHVLLGIVYQVYILISVLSGGRSDGLGFSRLRSIIRTQFGQSHFDAGIESLRRRVVVKPVAFLPEV